jgi:adenosylcobyric acid synthase
MGSTSTPTTKTKKNKSIMILGTGSTVGKSIICTALCRIFTQEGYDVNPFKSQNMSLNSYITHEGHEMGRAQVMQAEAARKAPSAKMNPILVKPTSDHESQIILNGKVHQNMDFRDFLKYKPVLKDNIEKIYKELEDQSDIVVLEGAGSPAEINLNENDIVNMGMAKIAKAPVLLVGDIDKGGVFASLAGTMLLLSEEEKSMVKGVVINKFRGSYELLEPGLKMLEDIIKIPVLGVIPHFELNLEDEDSVTDWGKFSENPDAELDVVVVSLPYMSNFTDFNALRVYEDINVRFVNSPEKLGKPDIVIIPGTKSTIADMNFIRESGFEKRILECYQSGSYVFGICGGYQMLGNSISDFSSIEAKSALNSVKGLGLLDTDTSFKDEKTTTLSEGIESVFGTSIKGYEIHMGETTLSAKTIGFGVLHKRNDKKVQAVEGAMSANGRVIGTYLHGIFDNSSFTRNFINKIRVEKGLVPIDKEPIDYMKFKDSQYDKLAEIVRNNLNMEKLYEIIEKGL